MVFFQKIIASLQAYAEVVKIMIPDQRALLSINVITIKMEGLTHYIYGGIWIQLDPDKLLYRLFYPARYFTTLKCSGHFSSANYKWMMCLGLYLFWFPGKNWTSAMNILTFFVFAPTCLQTSNSNSFLYKSKKLSYLYPLFLLLFCYHTYWCTAQKPCSLNTH